MFARLLRVARALTGVSALALTLVAVLAPSTAAAWKAGKARYGIGVHQNVGVKMADGTVLRADVYYPTDDAGKPAKGPFPALVTQTPYGKDSGTAAGFPGGSGLAGLAGYSPYLVERGYIDVIADVRGTGASGGSWGLLDPVQGNDGATLIRWASKLPNTTGKVGTLGASYLGITQFLAAQHLGRRSPLKAMFPIISANETYRDAVFDGGLLDFEFGGFYLALTGSLNITQPLLENLFESPPDPNAANVVAQHIGGLLTYHAAAVANIESNGDQAYDQTYWRNRSPDRTLAKIVGNHVPVFLVGGWFDLFQRGEPLNFAAMQNLWAGRPAGAPMIAGQPLSGRYQLLMGPWYHVSAGDGLNLAKIELRWFDRWLKNKPTGIDRTKTPLHLNQLGSGKYLEAHRYPFEGAHPNSFFLHPGGVLRRSRPPSSGGSDSVVYTGADSPCGRSTEQWGAGTLQLALQAANGDDPCAGQDTDSGPGVATYTAPAFHHPHVLAGPIGATLYAASTTPETEMIATISDVAPNGSSTPLTSGALLGSMRKLIPLKSWMAPDADPFFAWHPYTRAAQHPVPTGKLTRFDIEVRPTFALIAAGHRLRLTITTSDVPHLMPTAAQAAQLSGGVYSIAHNAAGPSTVELPIAPANRFTKVCKICR